MVGFHLAISFGRWDLTTDQSVVGRTETSIRGRVIRTDDYWSTRIVAEPTTALVWMGKTWWEWEVEAADIDGALVELRSTKQPRAVEVADS